MKAILLRSVVVASFGGLVLAAVPGCGSDDHNHDDHGHSGYPPECQRIIDACHYKDPGVPGEVNRCHTVGHTGTNEECAADADCVATCTAAPFPDGADGGA